MIFCECPYCKELVEIDQALAGSRTFVRKSKALDDVVQQTPLQFWFELLFACDDCGSQWALRLTTPEKELQDGCDQYQEGAGGSVPVDRVGQGDTGSVPESSRRQEEAKRASTRLGRQTGTNARNSERLANERRADQETVC